MMRAYVVTEGQVDAEILKGLLPENIVKDTEFVVGSGRYSAQSLARSVLAVRQLPVALVVDADTEDETMIQEQSDFLQESLRQASPGVRFQVFLAVPTIEILLFQDQSLLEELTGRKFSDQEWQIAKLKPKKFLTDLLDTSPLTLTELLDNLTDEALGTLRKYPPVSTLAEFLASMTMSD
jgi:hypothetical protein